MQRQAIESGGSGFSERRGCKQSNWTGSVAAAPCGRMPALAIDKLPEDVVVFAASVC